MTDAFVCWWGVQGFCKLELSIAQATTKKKVSDPTNFYNQAFNSHAAVFEIYLVRAKTRLVCFFADIKKKTRVV